MRQHFAFKRCTLLGIQPRLRSYQKTEFQSCRELALGNRDLSKRVSLASHIKTTTSFEATRHEPSQLGKESQPG